MRLRNCPRPDKLMASKEKYSELLISDTLVPDIFTVRYMPMLGKDALSIYLWTLMTYKGGNFTLKDVLAYGVIPEEDTKTALAELVTAGVLVNSEGTKFSFVDLKKIEVDEYVKSGTDEDGMPVMRSDEKRRNLLATSIQKTFYGGRMAYAFYKLIDKCLYEYKFEDQVVYALFEEGKDTRIQFSVPKMYELAQKWNDMGYTTLSSLKNYYETRQKRNGIVKLVGKLLRKRLNDMDYERIYRMIDVYKADEALVEYAIKSLEWKENIRIIDVENKIKEWYDAGVMTIDKAVVYEEERRKENKTKASRRRGRSNVRKSGKEAGITVSEPEGSKAEEAADEDEPFHDSILDMFAGDDDENDN